MKVEFKVDQILGNTTEKVESTTYLLEPIDNEDIKAKKWKFQITATDLCPCDFGELMCGDTFLLEIKKHKTQKKITDDGD